VKFKLIITALVVIAASCTKIERLENVHNIEKKLALHCFFNYGEPFHINLKHTLSVLDNSKIKDINNATVIIMENGIALDTIKRNTRKNGEYYYISKRIAVPGNIYEIHVSAPGYEAIYAKSDAPSPLNINNYNISYGTKTYDTSSWQTNNKFFYTNSMRVNINLDNIQTEKGFYWMDINQIQINNSISFTPDMARMSYSSNAQLEPTSSLIKELPQNYNLNGQSHIFYWPFAAFGSQTNVSLLPVKSYKYGEASKIIKLRYNSPISLIMKKMSPSVYDYFYSVNTLIGSQYDLLSQPTQIKGNIEGGEGVFGYLEEETIEFLLK
jgi:hypothetical protein